jgi:hypothetical protein
MSESYGGVKTKPRQPPPPKEEGKGLVTAKQLRLWETARKKRQY